jgi:hypothetical protein
VRGHDGQMVQIPSSDMAGLPSIMGYTQGMRPGQQQDDSSERVASSAAFTEGLRKYLQAQRNAADGPGGFRSSLLVWTPIAPLCMLL